MNKALWPIVCVVAFAAASRLTLTVSERLSSGSSATGTSYGSLGDLFLIALIGGGVALIGLLAMIRPSWRRAGALACAIGAGSFFGVYLHLEW